MRDFPRLTPAEARERAEKAAAALAMDKRVRLVFLFGSAVDPERASVRDFDLAVLTDPMDLWDLAGLSSDASSAAGMDFDLVWLNNVPPVLAREVSEGRCLYADPPEIETEFVTRSRMQYLDFKHYRDEQWRLSGDRLEEVLDGLPI